MWDLNAVHLKSQDQSAKMIWILTGIVLLAAQQIVSADVLPPNAEARAKLAELIGEITSSRRTYLDAAYSTQNKQIGRNLFAANASAQANLKQRLTEASKLLSGLPGHIRSPNLNLSECTDYVTSELEAIKINVQDSLSRCFSNLLSTVYPIDHEIWNQANKHINAGLNEAQKEVDGCVGAQAADDCYRKFVEKVDNVKSGLKADIQLYTGVILAASEGMAIPCEDLAFAQWTSSVAILAGRVTSCIRSNTLNHVGSSGASANCII